MLFRNRHNILGRYSIMRTFEGDDVGFFDGDLVGTGLVGEELGLFEGLLLGVDVGLVVGDVVGNGVVGEELGLGFDSFGEQRDGTSQHELSRELSRVNHNIITHSLLVVHFPLP